MRYLVCGGGGDRRRGRQSCVTQANLPCRDFLVINPHLSAGYKSVNGVLREVRESWVLKYRLVRGGCGCVRLGVSEWVWVLGEGVGKA